MAVPPSDEGGEVLQPPLLSIPCHTGAAEETPSDQYCVGNGVREGAGLAVINNIKHDKNLTGLTLTLWHI